MPIVLSLFFPQFPLFSSLFSFLSFFFSFTLFSFFFREYSVFRSIFKARQRSFYSACRGQFLPLCPLIAFVWSGRTCWPPKVCDTHPCQTKAGLFHSSVHRSTLSCHNINAFFFFPSRHAPNGSPLNLASFGWSVIPARRTSQKGLGRSRKNRSFPLSPPPNHTPFTSYLWPMAPPRPILVGYRLVMPGPYACFPFRYVQKSFCCSCVCCDLETLRSCFLTFYVGFSLVSRSIQELNFVWWWALHFFAPFSIFFISCNVVLLFLP